MAPLKQAGGELKTKTGGGPLNPASITGGRRRSRTRSRRSRRSRSSSRRRKHRSSKKTMSW